MNPITVIIPHRDRPAHLATTLEAVLALGVPLDVIVVDNDSASRPDVPTGVRLIALDDNRGAASRNVAAAAARGDWLLMLDDDSHPLDAGFIDVARHAPDDVAAIGAEIRLPSGERERGGLPEVIIGCGALIRRDRFVEAGGYDESFQYYVEEYDLCARFLAAGARVMHDPRFRVLHRKTDVGRDMNLILRRLVRNNGWVDRRYTPADRLDAAMRETIRRYGEIALREAATEGYVAGLVELMATLDAQPRRPLPSAVFDRFVGRAALRTMLDGEDWSGRTVSVVERGKHDGMIIEELRRRGGVIAEDADDGEVIVIGTLSPGPAMDGRDRWRADGRPVFACAPDLVSLAPST